MRKITFFFMLMFVVLTSVAAQTAFVPTRYESTNIYNLHELPGVKLLFSEAVVSASLAEGETSYAYVLDADGDRVLELDKLGYISGSLKYVSLTNKDGKKVTVAGEYKVVVTATVKSASGKVYAGGECSMSVGVPPVEINIDAILWNTLSKIPTTINLTITNAEDIVLDATKKATYTVDNVVYEAAATLTDNVITLSFDENCDFIEGEYVFNVPVGMFTCDGVENEEKVENFTYVKPIPLTVVSVTPTEGALKSIATIKVQFNQEITPLWEFELGGRVFVRSNGDLATNIVVYTAYIYDVPNSAYIESPVTEPGEYLFDIANVVEEALADGEQATYTWVIEAAETAIENVAAVTEKSEVYDLAGRSVKEIVNAGIYIVNGNKVLVK